MSLLPVEEALRRVLDGARALPAETVPVGEALDRILAEDIASLRTQPPWDTSAMDGYAVRAADVATVPADLNVIGSAPAGHSFGGSVGPGEAVRIFTGAPMPAGADAIVIQEDTERDGDTVKVLETSGAGRFVRRRGLDFAQGEVLLTAGRRLGPRHIALAAAMNHATLPVRQRPKVAILATGDELVPPGTDPGPDGIIASNGYGIAALVRRAGGIPLDLGIAPDSREAIASAVSEALGNTADVLVTLGGASVGEHDIVQDVLEAQGLALDFWKIAMRPGKPLIFGRLGDMRVLGLPGNPVSSMVCGRLFVVPLIHELLAQADPESGETMARLGGDLKENDQRQDYLRATLDRDDAGGLIATPFAKQDSSMLATLVRADAFIIRPPHAPPARAGETCRVLVMDF
jgi:molybdopterin molybdotransferase